MADEKRFGLRGVNADLQFGKRGGRIIWDPQEGAFSARGPNGEFYVNFHVDDPTEDSHTATKRYVDDTFDAIQQAPEFYLFVGETGDGPVFDGVNTIKFNEDHFYAIQSGSTVTINLRDGKFRDPLFRKGTFALTGTFNVGSPLPEGAVVNRVKLVFSEEYDDNATEVTVESATGSPDQVYMSADENDPKDKDEDVFISETDPRQAEIDGARQVVVNAAGGAPATGAGSVVVEYRLDD